MDFVRWVHVNTMRLLIAKLSLKNKRPFQRQRSKVYLGSFQRSAGKSMGQSHTTQGQQLVQTRAKSTTILKCTSPTSQVTSQWYLTQTWSSRDANYNKLQQLELSTRQKHFPKMPLSPFIFVCITLPCMNQHVFCLFLFFVTVCMLNNAYESNPWVNSYPIMWTNYIM